tara:strand:- start:536 stop:970 length:435 start_codon:yes stop_codon:yes gene_type:complete
MGTRSNIAYQKKNGEVVAMYCHYDGYPEYNGVILNNHYATEDKAIALVDNGYQSNLKETVERSNIYREHEDAPVTYRSMYAFLVSLNFDIEWIYLFKNGRWYLAETELISIPNGMRGYDLKLLNDTDFLPLNYYLYERNLANQG